MTVYRGVTMIYTEGKPISGLGSSAFLKFIGKGAVFGIPFPVIVLVVVFAIFYFVLNKTTFGRRIYATGSNAECAKLAGVNINKTKLIAYGVSGLMSAMAGLILLSRLSSAQPTLGSGYELDAIAGSSSRRHEHERRTRQDNRHAVRRTYHRCTEQRNEYLRYILLLSGRR